MKVTPLLKVLLVAVALGLFMSVYFPIAVTQKLQRGVLPWGSSCAANSSSSDSSILATLLNTTTSNSPSGVARNPKGAERLPPRIVVSESDLHLRRLWGSPREDTPTRKYLLAMAAGYSEKVNVNATVHKFSDNFDVILFHYDGHTTEWDEFEWSKQATHVSARQQTKWWFAKRMMHPSIVAPYDYIFLWDEDLGVENFAAEPYIDIVKKHGLEISQPGLDVTKGKKLYNLTVKRDTGEIHKTDVGGKHCPRQPCSGFVEVMAPVFSREAWRCVWHMIQYKQIWPSKMADPTAGDPGAGKSDPPGDGQQFPNNIENYVHQSKNDLIHGWGLDFNFWRCVDDPEERIGIVDTQYVVHQAVKTLIGKGNAENEGIGAKVNARCFEELSTFKSRMSHADKELANHATTSSSTSLS